MNLNHSAPEVVTEVVTCSNEFFWGSDRHPARAAVWPNLVPRA